MKINNLSTENLVSLRDQAIEALSTETFKEDYEFSNLLENVEEEMRKRY